jgi:hypothetical protein
MAGCGVHTRLLIFPYNESGNQPGVVIYRSPDAERPTSIKRP